MSQHDSSIKIRALPRKGEKPKPKSEDKPSSPRWIIYVGTSSAIILAMTFLFNEPEQKKSNTTVVSKKVQQTDSASTASRRSASISRHLQESQMHRRLLEQAQVLENAKVRTRDLRADAYVADEDARKFGVQFDQEDSADRVFEDLNVNSKSFAEQTPDEKINAKLANRRWVNEVEKQERITFLKNYIKSAYDRGFEVEINENLIVVGVRRVNEAKKLNIDQIVDKFAAKQP